MLTEISGKMPDSSQASRELSTASLSVVKTALVGDEKPTCCKFLEKYSAVLLLVICLLPRVVRTSVATFFASSESSDPLEVFAGAEVFAPFDDAAGALD